MVSLKQQEKIHDYILSDPNWWDTIRKMKCLKDTQRCFFQIPQNISVCGCWCYHAQVLLGKFALGHIVRCWWLVPGTGPLGKDECHHLWPSCTWLAWGRDCPPEMRRAFKNSAYCPLEKNHQPSWSQACHGLPHIYNIIYYIWYQHILYNINYIVYNI